MARIGRPKTKIDRGEFLAAFARMSPDDRERALDMMAAIHAALLPVNEVEDKVPVLALEETTA